MIVHVAIGNSDDKLTQREWRDFISDTRDAISVYTSEIHGEWFSAPESEWQNACWCFELDDEDIRVRWLRDDLHKLADKYGQDGIAWTQAAETIFLS